MISTRRLVHDGMAAAMALVLGLPAAPQGAATRAPQAPTSKAQQSSSAVANDALRKKAWKILEEAANGKYANRRAKAIHALGIAGSERQAVKLAENALEDKEPTVREAAATALGEMRSAASIPRLQKALDDHDLAVALAAAGALVAMKNDAGYDADYEVLTGTRKSGVPLTQQALNMLKDRDKLVDMAIVRGIEFAPFGGYGLAVWRALHRNSSAPVRANAAMALARDPDARSAQALVKASKDKEWIVRAAALKAIGLRGDAGLAAKIKPALGDKTDIVRFAAAASILRLSALSQATAAK